MTSFRSSRSAAAVRGAWIVAVPAVLLAAVGVLHLPLFAGPVGATNHGDAAARITVRAVDERGFTVELTVPTEALRRRAGTSDGSPGTLPTVTGDAAWRGSGWEYGWLFGVPERGSATVELLDADTVTIRGVGLHAEALRAAAATPRFRSDRLLEDPATLLEAVLPELSAIRASRLPDAALPAAQVQDIGRWRDQAVGRLVIRPLARSADGDLVARTRVLARIRFNDPWRITRCPPADGPFAALAAMLLNQAYPPCRCADVVQAFDLERGSRRAQAGGNATDEQTSLKVVVNGDGPVIVSGALLESAGWDLSALDATALSMSVGGEAQAFAVRDGSDGSFDREDAIVFQGRAMTGPYTRDNVYWLRAGGPSVGFGQRAAAPGTGTVAQPFTRTERFEQDTRVIWSMTPSEGADRWMWGDGLSAPAGVTHTLRAGNLASDGEPAALRVALQGYTDDVQVSPDHHVRLWWNERLVLDTRVDGQGVHLLAADLARGALVEGDNRFVLESVGDTGASVDTVFLNWIELDHAGGYAATGDRLDFIAPSGGRLEYALTGFTDPLVRVLDVTEPRAPVALSGVEAQRAGDGTYTVRFSDEATPATRYVAFAEAGAEPPSRIVPDLPSDLRSAANRADYIVITHPDFAAAIAPLAAHRAGQGLSVKTVLVDDIYDEFSHGVFDPRAIRSFLRHASSHWAPPAPTYVLLVGEANLDYRRGYGAGPLNYVPSVHVVTPVARELTLYTSDTWFAQLHDGDVLPDVLLGRISAARAEDVATVVDKILRYETSPAEAGWRERAILVADDDGAEFFEPASERLAAVMPPGMEIQRFYAAGYPRDRDLAADIRAAVDRGAFALNFVGHGNVNQWGPWPGGGPSFDLADIGSLTNGDRMPVFTAGTCMNGWIDHPLKPVSMTEQWLVHPAGGGIVAWAASGYVGVSEATALLEPFYRGMYDGRRATAGQLAAAAGAEAVARNPGYGDVFGMFVLLGDPATVLSASSVLPTPRPSATPTAGGRSAWIPFAVGAPAPAPTSRYGVP